MPPRSLRTDWLTPLRRFLWIGAFAYWVGGFTFYGSVVIPNASRVVAGGEAEFGFVTRLVTNWLNLIGVIALVIFAADLAVGWADLPRWLRLTRLLLVALLAACEVVLIATHPRLDRLLRPADLGFVDRTAFRHIHKLYLMTATVQWLACVAFLGLTVLAWSHLDRWARESAGAST